MNRKGSKVKKARIVYEKGDGVWFVQTRFLWLFWRTIMLTPKRKRAFGTEWLAQAYLEWVILEDLSNLSVYGYSKGENE